MSDPYKRTRKYGDEPGRKPRRVHRIEAEKLLERPLLPTEVVHHRDGDKTNNVLENLEVLPSQRHHMTLEHYESREARGIAHLFDLETWMETLETNEKEYDIPMTATLEKPKVNKVRAALEQADHSLRLEGLRQSDFAAPLFERLARGEITASEMKAQLDAQYKPR